MHHPKVQVLAIIMGIQAAAAGADHETTHIVHKTLRQNPYQPTYEAGTLSRSGAALVLEDRPHVLWVRHQDRGRLNDETSRQLGQLLGFADAYPSQTVTQPIILRDDGSDTETISKEPASTPPTHSGFKPMPSGVLRDGYYGKEFSTPPDAALSVDQLENAPEPGTAPTSAVQPYLPVDAVISRAEAHREQRRESIEQPSETAIEGHSVSDDHVQHRGHTSRLGIDLSKWQEPPSASPRSANDTGNPPSLEEVSILVELPCDDDDPAREKVCY